MNYFSLQLKGLSGDQWKTITMAFGSRINLGPNQGKFCHYFLIQVSCCN